MIPKREYKQPGNCSKCGIWRRSLHRDHIIPKFKGGANDPSNIQHICANCHEDKTRNEIYEWIPKKRSKETCLKLSQAVRNARERGAFEERDARANITSHTEEAKAKRLATRALTKLLTPEQLLAKKIAWQKKQIERFTREIKLLDRRLDE